jgi:hypothetical protein
MEAPSLADHVRVNQVRIGEWKPRPLPITLPISSVCGYVGAWVRGCVGESRLDVGC